MHTSARPTVQALGSSFRDPAGFVFRTEGLVYRQVSDLYAEPYDQLMASGLYRTLTERRLLIPHAEVHLTARPTTGVHKILRPEQIRSLSYPYEWCFGQLKDAALTTLAIQRTAIEHGMSLKDASAYNIQFRGCQPVLIDTLSFEIYKEGQAWTGYRQFCQYFLAPLALMSTVDVRLAQLLRIHIDGVPLDLASRLLPARTYLRPSLLLHVHLHAQAQRRFSKSAVKPRRRPMGRNALLGLIDSLQSAVEALRWEPHGTVWAEYDQNTHYSSEARRHKEDIVRAFLATTDARMVWDLGANCGRFSRMAAAQHGFAVAFDSDYGAVESHYRICRDAGETTILPLVLDLTNPSPALGWAHDERLAWAQRGPVDVVLALALIHHLAIGNNVPLPRIAELLHRLGARLIIEFVPKGDPQVQPLLASRDDVFGEYSQVPFERAFERHFRIRQSIPIRDSQRVLYLMERR
jgi:hypothetical protein